MSLQIVVFDVEHGFCALIITPTQHAIMIDCGKSKTFSPAKFVVEELSDKIIKDKNKLLSKLIVTHPHEDHIEDIEYLIEHMPPARLQRAKSIPLDKMSNSPGYAHQIYNEWQQTYTQPADPLDYGLDLKHLHYLMKK